MNSNRAFEEVMVETGEVNLPGLQCCPEQAAGMVIFAHGSGSSRLSSRNQAVAHWLNDRGCSTLLFDLLTDIEGKDRQNVFDINLLGQRMIAATRWLRSQAEFTSTPIAFFGSSTGAAAALVAASALTTDVTSVVSRGGRPDLAIPVLPQVVSPTLLIVGSRDEAVLGMNKEAQAHITCENKLAVIDGATHLFEEPGTLEQAAEEAGDWFVQWFSGA